MTLEDKMERLKQIKIENIVWLIYIILIAICLYGNKLEKQFILFQDNYSKNKYRKVNILIFTIATIIYLYFFIDNYKGVQNLKITDSKLKKDLNKLSLLGSSLILISGLIFLYIAITDTNVEVEIAFN